ncbi:MmcQ/YjbR family DNA-binding protein [Henriciella litoralis]|uniref:MmcQ/YjbR family DNA-binding protein n=1 Tax=Henriciella litoralis TaxID=568102 RepID=UPI000A011F67
MDIKSYNSFCGGMAHTTHVVQWGGAHVWKIGGKVFAIAHEDEAGDNFRVSFKVSDLAFDILKEQEGCKGAPHLASRGMKWIQRFSDATLDDEALKLYLAESYRIVSLGLTKTLQRELGLNQ